jgi:hypothetical protein
MDDDDSDDSDDDNEMMLDELDRSINRCSMLLLPG